MIRGGDGWLAPGGTFYACDPGGHGAALAELDVAPDEAERAGWLVLRDGEWVEPSPSRPLSYVQYSLLVDWFKLMGTPLPDWVYVA